MLVLYFIFPLLVVVSFLAFSDFLEAEHLDFLICGYLCLPVSRLCSSVKHDSNFHCSLKWRAGWFCSVRVVSCLCLLCLLESQSKPTSSEPAAQHLDSLKHICQTHSRSVCKIVYLSLLLLILMFVLCSLHPTCSWVTFLQRWGHYSYLWILLLFIWPLQKLLFSLTFCKILSLMLNLFREKH